MITHCIPLPRYSPLPSTEDSDTVTWKGSRYVSWLALRRVRTTLAAGVALFVVYWLSISFDFPSILRASQASDTGVLEASVIVNWTDFAYVQYVTNGNYLCNSLMILEALHRSGAQADRIMMYPEEWEVPEADAHNDPQEIESRLLAKARDFYGTKLVPVKLQTFSKGDPTWKDSYTKLLAFNQTQYKRVMSLDSDATVQDHMDELFLSPSSPVAMPRAYWLDQPFLSSQLVLLEPSQREWQRIEEFMNHEDSGFDMDILNTLYKDSCLVLPHRRYNLLSGELRGKDHTKYLGSNEAWNGTRILDEAKFVHFSDWPVPKPWLKASDEVKSKNQPECVMSQDGGAPDCTDRDLWLGLYQDFSDRRERICGRDYDNKKRTSLQERRAPLAPK